MSSLRDQLVQRLKELGVEEHAWPGRDDGFSSLLFRDQDFGHFHDDHEVDLRLGSKLIKNEGLVHPANSRVHPRRAKTSQWFEIRFTKESDVDEVIRLVRLAIKAA